MGKRAKPSRRTRRNRKHLIEISQNVDRMVALFENVPPERRHETLEAMRRESQMPEVMFALIRDAVLGADEEE